MQSVIRFGVYRVARGDARTEKTAARQISMTIRYRIVK